MSYGLLCLIALRRHQIFFPLCQVFYFFCIISAARLATSAVPPTQLLSPLPSLQWQHSAPSSNQAKSLFSKFSLPSLAACAFATVSVSVSVSGSAFGSGSAAARAAYFWPLHIFQLVFGNCLAGKWETQKLSIEWALCIHFVPCMLSSVILCVCVCGAPSRLARSAHSCKNLTHSTTRLDCSHKVNNEKLLQFQACCMVIL